MTIGFIPAKVNSSRIPGKNLLRDENGDTLVTRSVKWMRYIKSVDLIHVSTDNLKALIDGDGCDWMRWPGVICDQRTPELSDPDLPLIDLYQMIPRMFEKAEHVIATQPDNPIKPDPKEVEALFDELRRDKRDEVFSVDRNGTKTGALHIFTVEALKAHKLAYYCKAVTQDIAFDINSPADWASYQAFMKVAGTI